eukprot:GHVU01077009.1.p1 GENE.GHVU01077009.1~~GHVU01077009.1.p1  ORF type:complete len:522 (+),score=45.10 GHVU01077009.1:62-1627(+)
MLVYLVCMHACVYMRVCMRVYARLSCVRVCRACLHARGREEYFSLGPVSRDVTGVDKFIVSGAARMADSHIHLGDLQSSSQGDQQEEQHGGPGGMVTHLSERAYATVWARPLLLVHRGFNAVVEFARAEHLGPVIRSSAALAASGSPTEVGCKCAFVLQSQRPPSLLRRADYAHSYWPNLGNCFAVEIRVKVRAAAGSAGRAGAEGYNNEFDCDDLMGVHDGDGRGSGAGQLKQVSVTVSLSLSGEGTIALLKGGSRDRHQEGGRKQRIADALWLGALYSNATQPPAGATAGARKKDKSGFASLDDPEPPATMVLREATMDFLSADPFAETLRVSCPHCCRWTWAARTSASPPCPSTPSIASSPPVPASMSGWRAKTSSRRRPVAFLSSLSRIGACASPRSTSTRSSIAFATRTAPRRTPGTLCAFPTARPGPSRWCSGRRSSTSTTPSSPSSSHSGVRSSSWRTCCGWPGNTNVGGVGRGSRGRKSAGEASGRAATRWAICWTISCASSSAPSRTHCLTK